MTNFAEAFPTVKPVVPVVLAIVPLFVTSCSEAFDLKCSEITIDGDGITGCDTADISELEDTDTDDGPDDPYDCEVYRAKYPPFPIDEEGKAYPLEDHDYGWQQPDAIMETFYTNLSTDFDFAYTDSEGRYPANSDAVREAWDKALTAWSGGGTPSPDFTLNESAANDRTSTSATDGLNWVWMYDNPVEDITIQPNEFALTECLFAGCLNTECDIALRKYREIGSGPGTGDHVPILWVTGDDAGPGQVSLTKAFAHEWGHVLGLSDFYDPETGEQRAYFPDSVAWPLDMDILEVGGYSWEGISEDDYAAAVWIYGPD